MTLIHKRIFYMRVSIEGVFLSGSLVEVKQGDVKEQKILAQFHQPDSKNNKLISVVIPKDKVLEQYEKYTVIGDLTAWAWKDQVSMRITAIEIK